VRTAIWLVCAGAAFIVLLSLAEIVTRRWALRPELGRKLAHMSSSVLAAALPLILSFPAIVGLAAAFTPFMVVSRRLDLFPLLHHAERSSFGEIYFPLGVLMAAALVPHWVEFAFGVLVMGICDPIAALSGQRFGRRSYRLTAQKTYLGSIAFLTTAVVFGLVAMGVAADLSGRALLVSVSIATIVTLEEAALGGGADNVFLPVTAAALLRWLA
jgi:phytol kinase